METVCAVELAVGKRVRFPFGIRAYVIATK
jgi:hypothetical protein